MCLAELISRIEEAVFFRHSSGYFGVCVLLLQSSVALCECDCVSALQDPAWGPSWSQGKGTLCQNSLYLSAERKMTTQVCGFQHLRMGNRGNPSPGEGAFITFRLEHKTEPCIQT